MGTPMPIRYVQATQYLEYALASGKPVTIAGLSSESAFTGVVSSVSFEPYDNELESAVVELNKAFANILMSLNITLLHNGRRVNCPLELLLLCPAGDCKWVSDDFIDEVWGGKYPVTVAINRQTGDVFWLFIQEGYTEIKYFMTMCKEDFEAFSEFFMTKKPYYITLDPEVMFDVLSGKCERSTLADGITLVINIGRPLKLHRGTEDCQLIENLALMLSQVI